MDNNNTSSAPKRFYKLYLSLLKQHRGFMVLLTCILFVLYSLPYIMAFLESPKDAIIYASGSGKNFNEFSMFFFIIYITVVPLLLGVRLFGYMHSKRSVDLYHSLPIKRSELYLSSSAIGLTMLTIPIFINFMVVITLQIMNGYGVYSYHAFGNMFLWIVAGYSIMAVTGLCAVNVGSQLDTYLFSVVLNAAPTIMFFIYEGIRSTLLYGYVFDHNLMDWATRLSPIPTMLLREVGGLNKSDTLNTMIVWAIIGVLITALSMFIYRKRKSEMAEVVGNFGPAQIIVRIIVYYIGTALFAIMFYEFMSYEYDESYFTIGAVLGAFVTGVIGEMLMTRSPRRTLKRLPIIIGVMIFSAAASFLYLKDGFGFESYVPTADNIKSVEIEINDGYEDLYDHVNYKSAIMTEPEVISKVVDIHKAQIDAFIDNGYSENFEHAVLNHYTSIDITYTMNSGKTVSRTYSYLDAKAMESIALLSQNPSYVQQNSEFFVIEPADINFLGLMSVLQDKETEVTLTPEQKKGLLEAIRSDLQSRDPVALMDGKEKIAGLMNVNILYYPYDETDEYLDYGTTEISLVSTVDKVVNLAAARRRKTEKTSLLAIYESDTAIIEFLEQNDMLQFVEADYSKVSNVWVLSDEYLIYYFNENQAIEQINTDTSSHLRDAISNYTQEGIAPYDTLIEVPIERLDALLEKSISSYRSWDADIVLLAFETDETVKQTGYLLVPFDDLPSDIKAAYIKAGESEDDYDPFNKGNIIGEGILEEEIPVSVSTNASKY